MDIPRRQIWATESPQIAPQQVPSLLLSPSPLQGVCDFPCVLSSLRLGLNPFINCSAAAAAVAGSNNSSLCLSHPFSERMSHTLSTFHAPRHSLVRSLEALTALYLLYTWQAQNVSNYVLSLRWPIYSPSWWLLSSMCSFFWSPLLVSSGLRFLLPAVPFSKLSLDRWSLLSSQVPWRFPGNHLVLRSWAITASALCCPLLVSYSTDSLLGQHVDECEFSTLFIFLSKMSMCGCGS